MINLSSSSRSIFRSPIYQCSSTSNNYKLPTIHDIWDKKFDIFIVFRNGFNVGERNSTSSNIVMEIRDGSIY